MQVAVAENGGRNSATAEGGASAWPPSWAEGRGGRAEGPTVCRTEWTSGADGLQRRAQLETTHWSAPAHSYGKVVAGMEVVSGAGVHARRQVEVVSARAPGIISVMRASHSSSHSRSTNAHFEDMQISLNRLDIGSTNTQWSNSGGGGKYGFESNLPSSFLNRSTINYPPTQHKDEQNSVGNMKDVNNECGTSIKPSKIDSNSTSTYKVNFPDNDSEDSFYDSCPEKESVFKDETRQLEEWRRASKIRRSLQFPRRTSASRGKVNDLPDNVGSVDRIKRELESINQQSSHSTASAVYIKNEIQNITPLAVEQPKVDCAPEKPEDNFGMESSLENFTIKPSILKTKKFIAVERLNEVRERLKYLSGENKPRIENNACNFVETIPKPSSETPATPGVGIRSYMFGMDTNTANKERAFYPRGTNSLESRSSKSTNSSSCRNDDWYTRRKSYGFEKVQNSVKNDHSSLSSRDRDNIESSTDSGIWRSTEIVNAISNSNPNPASHSTEYSSTRLVSGGAAIQGNSDAHSKETFEDWLVQNRKIFTENLYNCTKKDIDHTLLQIDDDKINTRKGPQHTDLVSVSDAIQRNELSFKNSLFKNNYKYYSEKTSIDNGNLGSEYRPQSILESMKNIHDSKVSSDTKREISPNSDMNRPDEDTTERKNKKVEFCKTEVHFAAESGRVNIVETDGKPPSTNNFRRRRRNSGGAAKDVEKNSFPVMHFGDGARETETTEFQVYDAENADDRLKLNFAVITEIKPRQKDASIKPAVGDPPYSNDFNCDDISESDQLRGILKNNPAKPRPYHLGDDRQILSESASEKPLWGIKLRPIQDTAAAPLWKSTVALKTTAAEHTGKDSTDNKFTSSTLPRLSAIEEARNVAIEKPLTCVVNKINNVTEISNTEMKGYSTKVNFGYGEPIIETSFSHLNNQVGSTNDYLSRSKPTLVRFSGKGLVKNLDAKLADAATKIITDVTQTDSHCLKIEKPYGKSPSELKSTALVRNTEMKTRNAKYRNEMITIKRNEQNIKTALKSKLYETQKTVLLKEFTDDSADEEVRNLMIERKEASTPRAFRDTHRRDNFNRIFILSNDTKSPTNIINKLKIQGRPESTEMNDGIKNTHRKTPSDDFKFRKDGISNVRMKKSILEDMYKSGDPRAAIVNRTKLDKEEIRQHFEIDKQPIGTVQSAFAETLSTPRAAIPARGSARKLKDHELSYFGVKDSTAGAPTVGEKLKTETKTQTSHNRKRHDPIYENVTSSSVKVENKMRIKHPGEMIIEELTKAADEILQALDGHSDGVDTTDDDRRHKDKYVPMATISETNSVSRREKSSGEIAQTDPSAEAERHRRSANRKTRTRTSSNSSLESLTRDTVSSSNKSRSNRLCAPHDRDREIDKEKPHKKKVSSSGEVVRARRLQRAHSRDALYRKHGSSSEDMAQAEVIRKKTKRIKHGSDVTRTSSKVLTYKTYDQNESVKESNKSIAAATPDYNHKPAVSTIKSLHDRHSRREKDKNNAKMRSSGRERINQSEKSSQNSLSSHSRRKVTPPEKSRSVDTSLERESGHSREKIHSRESAKKRIIATQEHGSRARATVEEPHGDAGRRVKTHPGTNNTEHTEYRSGKGSKNAEGPHNCHPKHPTARTERVKKSEIIVKSHRHDTHKTHHQ